MPTRSLPRLAAEAATAKEDVFLAKNPPQIVYHGFQAEDYVLRQGGDAQLLFEPFVAEWCGVKAQSA